MYSTVAGVKENKLQPDDQLDRQNQPCSIWHSQAMHGADTGQEEQQEGEVHPILLLSWKHVSHFYMNDKNY